MSTLYNLIPNPYYLGSIISWSLHLFLVFGMMFHCRLNIVGKQSVDLSWRLTLFTLATTSLLHKNQHASTFDFWKLLLSHSLSCSLCLSVCCLFSFICCKGHSGAAQLCCQKPLFTKGRNKWVTQTAAFIPASPQALFPSTAKKGGPSNPSPTLHFCQASPIPLYCNPPSCSLKTHQPTPLGGNLTVESTPTNKHTFTKTITAVVSYRNNNGVTIPEYFTNMEFTQSSYITYLCSG